MNLGFFLIESDAIPLFNMVVHLQSENRKSTNDEKNHGKSLHVPVSYPIMIDFICRGTEILI